MTRMNANIGGLGSGSFGRQGRLGSQGSFAKIRRIRGQIGLNGKGEGMRNRIAQGAELGAELW